MKKLLLGLLFSATAHAAAPVIWANGDFGAYLTNKGFQFKDGKKVFTSTVDPAAGSGVSAPIGSVCTRDNSGTGQLFLKTGSSNTSWTNVLTAASGLSSTLTSAHLYVGNSLNVATDTAITGDITISNTGVTAIGTNKVTNTMLRQSAGLSLVGRSANSTGNVADITAASDAQLLRRSGTSIGFGSIDLASSAAVGSSILATANGGLGSSSWTSFAIPFFDGTNFTHDAAFIFDQSQSQLEVPQIKTAMLYDAGAGAQVFDLTTDKLNDLSDALSIDLNNRVLWAPLDPFSPVPVLEWSGDHASSSAYYFDKTNSYYLTGNGSALTGVVAESFLGLSSGTSGGILYFASPTSLGSTAQQDQFKLMVGGGAAAPPATLSSAGSSGQVLRSGGAAANPAFSTATYPSTATGTGTFLRADGTNWVASTLTLPNTTTANQILYSSAASVVGQITTAATSALVTNSSSVPAFTSGSTANRVLRTDGTTVSFAQVAAATDISGALPLVNGGTGTAAASANAAFNALSPMTTGGDIIYGGASGVATRLANGTSGQFLKSNGTTTAPTWSNPTISLTAPTQQRFTSGSGTYTTPASVLYLRVRMVGSGAGGGGGGANDGGASGGGANSTFGTSLLLASAGGATGSGSTPTPGAGGTSSISSPAYGTIVTGGDGSYGSWGAATILAAAGTGGASAFGGAGKTGGGNQVAAANSNAYGAGGSGGGVTTSVNTKPGAGGGAGGFVDAIIASPSATYSYAVGAAGSGGAAGTNGAAGGNGAAGYIEVTEYYQ